ncbi:alpha/beta fold hydrolase [Aeromicrobium chenweiae]|uniref:Alpha/beta hydrolase n=1 Tax=Aeromicrobium chenweiae TaxID=2079793 RepID=A0A2S0WKZ1_9ACTN|nr:alpha/beta hydrolase [Aeromicrobium chenweiae]AWB92016.1 alpha/beta hydrolase [Aeromicrobium chenweiae]TGN32866.1 alpha/beta hydrolase [Aeromicrobium chenweiae]
MKVILVPGFWFDASSWDRIVPALEAAGHDVTALTLPGMESPDADRSAITLADHVAAVLAAIDATDGPVVLAGSSFSGKLVQIAAEERPESIALAVYVDSLPQPVRSDSTEVPPGVEIPFSWDELSDDEQRDLGPELREQIERQAIGFPAQVVRDGWTMKDGRHHDVRTLVVASGFDAAKLREWRDDYPEIAAEIDAHTDLTIVELPTSHWPHLTRPDELADILLEAI